MSISESSTAFRPLPASFCSWADRTPDGVAYAVREGERWRTTNWQTYVSEVRLAARALIGLGLEPGDRVAVLSRNRPEWTIVDFGCMTAGGVTVGIYPTSAVRQIRYILAHSGARILFVDDAARLETLEEDLRSLPDLLTVVAMSGSYDASALEVIGWSEFLTGADHTDELDAQARTDAIGEDDLAMLVYTSGTTGNPKAVGLSHGNVVAAAQFGLQLLGGGNPDDKVLSYLPLAHSAGRGEAVLAPALAGFAVYFTDSVERLAEDLREVRPDIFIGVPRVWEKTRDAIEAGVRAASFGKRLIYRVARRIGQSTAALRRRGEVPAGVLAWLHGIADRVVLAGVRQRTGLDDSHALLCGSAPVSEDVLEYLSSLGLDVREVYGLTECGGPATFNRHGDIRLGTVGRAFDGVGVRLSPDGELLIGGPHVFKGYFRDSEATGAALDGEWLRSGDLASMDDDGFVRIVGRKKDLIITAGGRNVSPQPIETMLLEHPDVSGAIVIGDGRKYLSALIALQRQRDRASAGREASGAAPADVEVPPDTRAEIERHVSSVNDRLAKSDTIKRFVIIPEPFSMARGELTPTMKQRRDAIEEHYRKLVDSLYD